LEALGVEERIARRVAKFEAMGIYDA
jgi:hypothetical protein